jgi:hypothetical protein
MIRRSIGLGSVAALVVACGGKEIVLGTGAQESRANPGDPGSSVSVPPDAPADVMDACATGLVTLATTVPAGTVYGNVQIALGAENVYFKEETDPNDAWKVPKCGGPATNLTNVGAQDGIGGGAITVNATGVYYGDADENIVSVPTNGGARTTLATGQTEIVALTADESNVYWTTTYGKIRQVPAGGGTITKLAENRGFPPSIAAGGGSVFWVIDGSVMSVPIGGGTLTTLATGQDAAVSIGVDSENVYWINGSNIMKVGRAGGVAATIASGQIAAGSIAVDGTSIYWTIGDPPGFEPVSATEANAPGGIVRVGVAGGTPVTLATAKSTPTSIAVDDTSVYWATSAGSTTSGAIMKLTPK